MIVHLIYATYSSGTLTVAEYIQSLLVDRGHACTIIPAGQTKLNEMDSADLLLFGSPSWERDHFKYNGQPHEDFFKLFSAYGYDVDAERDKRHSSLDLSGTPCAVFGLGDRKYPVFCGAVDILTDFLEFSKATSTVEPLRVDSYYYHEPERKKEIELWVRELLAAVG
ncbi:MAG: flavodoxin family protein [bacterium]